MKTSDSRKIHRFFLAAALGATLGFVTPAFGYDYDYAYIIGPNGEATRLGSLGEASRYADINDAGRVVGSFLSAEGREHAFITGPDGVGMTDLGTFGGTEAVATGINNSGQVVGYYRPAGGDFHAFITGGDGKGMTDLGTLGGSLSQAKGINDAGQVVGVSYTAEGDSRAFITGPDGKGMASLGTLGGDYSSASAINDSGQVAGYSNTAQGSNSHAFITGSDGKGMIDLVPLQDRYSSSAFAINNSGQTLVNVSSGSFPTVGFMTGPDGMGRIWLDIPDEGDGRFFQTLNDINNAGQVVGYTETGGGIYSQHAFVTGPNGAGVTYLDSLANLPDGITLYEAYGINNLGQVIAIGPIPPIPEPTSYALMLAGLALVGFMARSQKQIV